MTSVHTRPLQTTQGTVEGPWRDQVPKSNREKTDGGWLLIVPVTSYRSRGFAGLGHLRVPSTRDPAWLTQRGLEIKYIEYMSLRRWVVRNKDDKQKRS